MPFKYDPKKGAYVQSNTGKLKLPPASPSLASVKGLKITWKTPVLPAAKPKPPTANGG
jgi:hypothetical protein